VNFKNERLLVIAPHADDEVLGCGGLISRVKDEGGKVFVLIFNVGSISNKKNSTQKWKQELDNAMKYLNVDKYETIFDKSEDNRYLDSKPLHQLIEIVESKSSVSIDKVKPTIVAIPTCFSHHQDHIRIFEACIAALRPMREPLAKIVLSYEAPEHSKWSTTGIFEPNFYVNIDKYIETKITAFYKYKSQIKFGGRDKNSIKTQAEYRGHDIGQKYCESFVIHRFVS
jgi:N-acetylglucosamine malate deacetylase 1